MQHIGDIIASKVCGQNDQAIHNTCHSLIRVKQNEKNKPSGG